MRISLNEVKKYVQIPADMTDQALIDLIGSRLVEIEEVIDWSPKYQGIYIVKVVSAEKIPDTHLSLCKINAGSQRSDLAEDGLIQVVCGAPNVHAGMFAVWIAPGSIVPQTYGNENFRLGARKLRGYLSNGMLAAVDELDLGSDHEGIVEINPRMAHPGDSFAEVFELNDLILDVENKSLTHRPDCFGLIGFAREVSGILGQPFTEPTWPEITMTKDLPLSVEISDAELCPRYSCAVFDLPKYGKIQYLTYYGDVFLAKAGMRSIDPIVDLTNMIMLRTGQPLHAFDYDKLLAVGGTKDAKIIVRAAKPGETLQLLDGKTIECIPEDILITSNNAPVALAGAMGGKNTEIDASTHRVVLESATFSLYNLRKTQMAHGIFSEAITRFTKGQPAAMTLPVLAETVAELGQSVAPRAVVDEWPGQHPLNVVKITTQAINNLLGTNYSLETITKTLENVGFVVKNLGEISPEASNSPSQADLSKSAVTPSSTVKSSQKANFESLPASTSVNIALEVTAPIWRTDIHITEDIIEEVGRLLGYDNITLELPEKPFSGTTITPMLRLKRELRNILSDRLAMHELLTYSFVSQKLIEQVGQDPAESYKIVNSISPELQCFRQQIVPSLLDKVRENIKSGHKHFTLYEMNQVTSRTHGLDTDGVPQTQTDLGIVCLGDFYQLKADLFATLEQSLKIDIEYARIAPGSEAAKLYPYLEPVRSAEIFVNHQRIGAFGEVKAAVLRKFKLEPTLSACELNLEAVLRQDRGLSVEVQLSKFPYVERDLTLKVAADAAFGRIDQAIRNALDSENLIYQVVPVSIYQPDTADKNLSFHLKFASPEHTLEATEISEIIEHIAAAAGQVGGTVV